MGKAHFPHCGAHAEKLDLGVGRNLPFFGQGTCGQCRTIWTFEVAGPDLGPLLAEVTARDIATTIQDLKA